ncbi:hypothetical protein SORBI_3010G037101 [Sorghum bicolor]|uniref:Uncharacterized protein n=1 Tax=Sorghum bicolor TaxID=4558 RepID=A0A1W0VRA9_SORBI|nr:hypothetical protein SORBI_3010G037101 [Sorghum bicolor]
MIRRRVLQAERFPWRQQHRREQWWCLWRPRHSQQQEQRHGTGPRGAPTEEAEAAALRAASEELLLAAAAQVLGATTAVLLPACKLATIFATLLGSMTGYCASDVLWLLVACHGYVHGDLRVYYGFFVAMFLVALLVGLLASLGPCF